MQHLEFGQTNFNNRPRRLSSAIIQSKRFGYGCNCYVNKKISLLMDSFGTPLDEYDQTCLDLQKCYDSVNGKG